MFYPNPVYCRPAWKAVSPNESRTRAQTFDTNGY